LTESIVLALLGGILGVLIAAWSNRALPRLFSIDVNLLLDYRLLAFTASLSLMTGILFGVAPALRITRIEPGVAMKSGAFAAGPGRRLTMGRTLVVVQVAFSLLLVSGAGLLARTLWNLLQLDLGFNREHVLTVRIDPRSAGFASSPTAVLIRSDGRACARRARSAVGWHCPIQHSRRRHDIERD
jgi:hypothetical protein